MRRAGLTLVELLVVISIVAMLAASLFPVFRRSREVARATVCKSNVRQLAIALLVYDEEYQSLPYGYGGLDGKGGSLEVPPPSDYLGDSAIDVPGWWWFNYIDAVRYNTSRDMNVLRCPSRQIEDTELKLDILCGNYGVNRALCKSTVGGVLGAMPPPSGPFGAAFGGTPLSSRLPANEFEGTPLSAETINNPGETLLLMDSGYTLISWWHATKDPPVTLGSSIQDTAYVPGLEINRQRTFEPGQKRDAIGGRHPNRTVNVAFADGHVDRKKASDLLVGKTGDGGWKNSPLWVPH